ncbi:MAG: hypothetical protein EPO42_10750 [Gallionellaceae bacterium]|nr:MAG: hypothetical protein EPO42_10750 [Gallionellaceae bacterium]
MLAGLFGKKSDHPFANLKSAQQVLDDVPKTDALKALLELASWVESLRDHAEEFRLDHQVAVLRLLDEAAQPHLRKLLRDYFAVQPLNKFQENRIWAALNDFFTLSEQTHVNILALCRKGDRNASALKPQFALLAVRAIVAAIHRLKLASARYALVDPTLWAHLAEIYSFAETQNFQNELVPLYPGSGVNTSVGREFAGVMVWFSVGTGSLPPLHIHVAERLVAHLNKYLTVGKQAVEGSQWAINLAQPTPPMRVNAETTIHPGVRFLGMGGAQEALNNLVKSLEKGIVPQELNLGGAVYETELLRDVARQLFARCISPPPTRRNARRKLKVNLHVANGFFKLVENTDIGLNFNTETHEVWEVEDISATGFRSVTAPSALDSIKIGSLIGSKPENMGNWGVGIVRRLSRDAENNLHVGVEILANQVIGVSLGARDHSGAGEDNLALYLNKPNDNSGEAWLLMKPGAFASTRSFNMTVADKTYLLLPLGLVESGEDYDLARYRKMEQDTSAE